MTNQSTILESTLVHDILNKFLPKADHLAVRIRRGEPTQRKEIYTIRPMEIAAGSDKAVDDDDFSQARLVSFGCCETAIARNGCISQELTMFVTFTGSGSVVSQQMHFLQPLSSNEFDPSAKHRIELMAVVISEFLLGHGLPDPNHETFEFLKNPSSH